MISQHDPNGIRGIVFDLDGTLVDSSVDITRAINAMLSERRKEPLEPSQVAPLLGEGARNLVASIHQIVGLPSGDAELTRDTARYLELYQREPVRDSALFADARQALEHFRERGLRLGVCTNKGQRLALQVLEALDVLPFFTAVVGGDHLPVRKPDPEHLLATVRLLGLGPEQTLFVGDSPIDVECARRAGIHCRVVDWAEIESDGLRVRRFMDLAELTAGTPPQDSTTTFPGTSTPDSTVTEVQR
ncbi:HAD-IA family hydrolase [Nonomuraea insulae]|uniref:HAD-IA family hydrolase n=1 Tax=Nonomuraea insulae TaxID=1616787 RepID=A0ABW1CKJ1_9ACTN